MLHYRLSRARRVVENAFGILANKWRIFHGPIFLNPDNAIKVTLACCALHNYVIKESARRGEASCGPGLIDVENEDGTVVPGTWRKEPTGLLDLIGAEVNRANRPTRPAIAKRDDFRFYFSSNSGKVDWQDRLTFG